MKEPARNRGGNKGGFLRISKSIENRVFLNHRHFFFNLSFTPCWEHNFWTCCRDLMSPQYEGNWWVLGFRVLSVSLCLSG